MSREQLDALLAEARALREQTLRELNDLMEAEFPLRTPVKPWPWTTVWAALLQFGNHMREHATHLHGVRHTLDRDPTQPQRILADAEAAWGGLLAATVGLTDADLDAAPPDGAWTIRQVLEHVLKGERAYLNAIRAARREQ